MTRYAVAAAALLLSVGIAVPGHAQMLESSIAIGTSTTLWSDTLNESRRVLIHLPKHYRTSNKSYPTLYLLDGEAHFVHGAGIAEFLASSGRIPELIVIGVTNTARTRDLTPVTSETEKSPEAGGADDFLAFLAGELLPYIDRQYRTEPFRILAGHSFGGLFTVYALIERPAVFQAHIAISPSLWLGKQAMVDHAKLRLQNAGFSSHQLLYLSWADNEPNIQASSQRLAQWLSNHPPRGLIYQQRYYAGDDHRSTAHRGLYDGLEATFSGWRPPSHVAGMKQHYSLPQLQEYYARQSARFGYTLAPAHDEIQQLAMALLQRGEAVAALAMLRENVANFPYRYETHWNLAEGLLQLGKLTEAGDEFLQALTIAVANEPSYDDLLAEYRRKVAQHPMLRAPGNRSPAHNGTTILPEITDQSTKQ